MEQVSWNDIQDFIKRLKTRTGKRFRLPTEAEWEYACREGGRKVRYCNGSDLSNSSEINFDGRSNYNYSIVGEYRNETTPVASFSPNSLGLYDMSENVEAWTCSEYTDRYDGSEERCSVQADLYSLRGGSWYDGPGRVRAAFRSGNFPDYRLYHNGFRLARDN